MADLRPALEIVTESEYRALRFAVRYSLEQGLATDDFEDHATNRSLVSIARKLGVTIPPEYDDERADT